MAITRALISVSDKTGIVEFAQSLHERDVEILSTGGTAKLLAENKIPVTEVSDYTGFPEMMDGRVKTLHPKIHGGILGRRGIDEQVMADHHIPPIDLICVNLYPFEETIARPDCDLATAIDLRTVDLVVSNPPYRCVLDHTVVTTPGAYHLTARVYDEAGPTDSQTKNYQAK